MQTHQDFSDPRAIEDLGQRLLAGQALGQREARALLDIAPQSPAAEKLFALAQQVRQQYCGNNVRFCSILNAKAGNCSEDCSYCSQARDSSNQDYSKGKWMDNESIPQAVHSAEENGAHALALVAAWKGVREGPQLDMVCDSIAALLAAGRLRPDANLGILESQRVADRLKAAGVAVYGHNLETARSFYPQICSTHSFEERWNTITYVKKAGMGLCSGGILGMGESRDQRIEFAEQLRMIEPQMIPINFLNPLEGTGLAQSSVMDADEALISLAVLRLFLPDRNIMVAGGKEVTLGERLHEVFAAGVNAVMVGNYLTTLGTDPDYWHQALTRYGLQRAGGCGVD